MGRRHQGPGLLGRVDDAWRLFERLDIPRPRFVSNLGTGVERSEDEGRLKGADAYQGWHAVQLRKCQMGAQRDQIGGTVFTIDHDEIEAGHGEHLDRLVCRHPQQATQKLITRPEPCLERRLPGHYATIPAEAGHLPGDRPAYLVVGCLRAGALEFSHGHSDSSIHTYTYMRRYQSRDGGCLRWRS